MVSYLNTGTKLACWCCPGQALFNLGNLQRQCGEFEAAIANYEGVLEISPDHWRGLLNYSVALVGVGRHEDAKRALRRAFKLSGARLPFCIFFASFLQRVPGFMYSYHHELSQAWKGSLC